ncbi:MAG: CBS domain-containing protein [Bacteroidales bacterium]|nr:CBS domain-containing protein [Bacteroidales bacterium]
MIARKLIMDGIIPLKTSDTGKIALSWMEDYKIAHLPIVNDQKFLGLISDLDIYNLNSFDEPLGNHNLSLNQPFVKEYQHIYDVLKLVSEMGLTLIPVVDDKENYLGSITLPSLIKYFSLSLSVDNPGGIIVLELAYNNYSLTEIANIIESNDAKILSTFILSDEGSNKMDLILKINKIELVSILKTFERYNYFVKASFSEDTDEDDLRDRYNLLMNYLNV